MKYFIDESSRKPAYIQLYEQLRKDIADGVYPYKTKLPSKRLISAETGISVITAEHALELLCDEGYIEARERSGYFVTFQNGAFFPVGEESETIPKNDYKESRSHSFPFSVISKTMRRVLTKHGELILEKSPNIGMAELRNAISRYLLRSRGINALPEQIVIGSGSEYLYGIVTAILGRDRIYGIENPSYEKIEKVYRASGVRCELLPLAKNGIKSSALAETSASVLHITPYRSFPSGVTASLIKRREYLKWASEYDRFIVEDDFESEFTLSKKPEETIFSLSEKENVIYLNTFSKTISPSIRMGYMVLPKSLISAYHEKAGFYSCSVPVFEQYVLAELINSGDFERHINRVRRKIRKEKESKQNIV